MEDKLKIIEEWANERRFYDLKFNLQELLSNLSDEDNEHIHAHIDSAIDKLIYIGSDMTKISNDVDSRKLKELFERQLKEAKLVCEKYRYDFDKCFEEVMKEINSRKGSWNKKLGKWEKDANQDKKTLYKADFSVCKKN